MGSPSAISRHVGFPFPGKVCHTTCDFSKSRWDKLQVHLLTLGGLQPYSFGHQQSLAVFIGKWWLQWSLLHYQVRAWYSCMPRLHWETQVNLNSNELGTVHKWQFLHSPLKNYNTARPSSSDLWSQLLQVQRQEDWKFRACLGHSGEPGQPCETVLKIFLKLKED